MKHGKMKGLLEINAFGFLKVSLQGRPLKIVTCTAFQDPLVKMYFLMKIKWQDALW